MNHILIISISSFYFVVIITNTEYLKKSLMNSIFVFVDISYIFYLIIFEKHCISKYFFS